ncbi:MAG: glycerol-3-phosphate 1-O-acyltransferase PlsY [Cyanobacteria bacterium P01_A01_bin.84]
MTLWLSLCATLIVATYILGSIPTGYTAAKLLKGIDIREFGSGSTGATNVLRTLGKGPGAFVLLIDCLKGVLAIFLAYKLFEVAALQNWLPATVNPDIWQPWIVVIAGIMAILGHSKSIFLGFSGGKSVATSLGILLAMNWQVGLATFGVFALMMAITRIVSLSSICGAIAVSMVMVVLNQPLAYICFAIAGGIYVILRHKSNIERILAGTEPKIGQKVEANGT